MPRSNWRDRLALIALAVLVFGFVGTGLVQRLNVGNEGVHESARNSPSASQVSAKLSEPALWGEYQQNSDLYGAICQQPPNSDYADLCQQWRMAEYAERQVNWTERLFYLTIGEVAALVATIGVGIAATAAAFRSVAETRRIGEQQLRAYVGVHSVEPPEPEPNGKWIKVKVEFRNAGQTPALNVKSSTSLIVEPPPFDEKWNAWMVGSSGILLPNAPIFQTAELHSDNPNVEARLDPQDVHRLFRGDQSIALWVCGKVTYSDIFGKEHWTTFRFIMNKRKGLSAVFTACPDGNETDD